MNDLALSLPSFVTMPPVLDACCGSRMFWFDRADARAVFMDVREGEWSKDCGTEKTAGRSPIVVRPDVAGDFTEMRCAERLVKSV